MKIKEARCVKQGPYDKKLMVGSVLFGVGWGYIINSINNKELQYYTSEDNTCTMPKRRMFKVNRLYKNKNK